MTRKSHIKRITGKSKPPTGGEPPDEPDVYVDVARIDTLDTIEWPGAQENQINLQWQDAPGETGNSGRRMGTVKLIDPEETNRNDPAVWIELPVIERMMVVRHPGAQEQVTSFQPSSADPQADELQTARHVAIRRITFAETNVDAQLDDNGYLADDSDYTRKADTIDDSQYLDVEVIESYPSTLHPGAQDVTVTLDNDAIKEMFSVPPGDAKHNPARLDPFQNIINVCWGGGATEIPPDAVLHQSLATTSDPDKITIAIFCYLSGAGLDSQNDPDPNDGTQQTLAGVPLIMFGHKPLGDFGTIDREGVQPSYIQATEDGVFFNLFGTRNCQMWAVSDGFNLPTTPYIGNNDGTDIRRDGWNCILLSFDATQGRFHNSQVPDITWPAGNYETGTLRFFVNGSDFADQVMRAASTVDGGWVDQVGGVHGSIGGPPLEQPWSICINEEEFAVPSQETATPTWPRQDRPKVAYGYIQVWTDRALDFSDPDVRAKFMKPDADDPAKPRMVDPSVAQDEYGKPTFFFDGPPPKFATNKGSGGEFTKTGELKSFRPAPPKAPTS